MKLRVTEWNNLLPPASGRRGEGGGNERRTLLPLLPLPALFVSSLLFLRFSFPLLSFASFLLIPVFFPFTFISVYFFLRFSFYFHLRFFPLFVLRFSSPVFSFASFTLFLRFSYCFFYSPFLSVLPSPLSLLHS